VLRLVKDWLSGVIVYVKAVSKNQILQRWPRRLILWTCLSWSLGTEAPAATAKADKIAAATATHWAFQPVPPLTPEATIDTHVEKNLQSQGLAFSPAADLETLVRRAYFNLIGLPPTYDELQAVRAAGQDPAAFEKIVDQLLADPRFGERWGRHWLDIARYADSKGYVFKEEASYPYSYVYRDWVIQAFNEDLTYERFILAQLAADQSLGLEDKRHLAAMGYLTLGRRFLNNLYDIVDDRIDVTFRGLQGLTVSCARCHDHKSDPIPTADYYSLFGVFASSEEPAEGPLLGDPEKSPHYEEYKKGLGEKEHAVTEYVREEIATALSAEKLPHYFTQLADYWSESEEVIWKKMKTTEFQPALLVRWRNQLREYPPEHPQWGLWARLCTTPADQWASQYAAAFAAWQPQADPAWVEKISSSSPASLSALAQSYATALLSEDPAWVGFLQTYRDSVSSDLWVLAGELEGKAELDIADLKAKVEHYKAHSPHTPPRAMVLQDKNNPYQPAVFKRGNPDSHGETVPRQFLQCLTGETRQPFTKGSGRLEMAQAITRADNPLTSRVYVNRAWGWVTGQPLVDSTSDFGLQTPQPLQLALLDHLARRFMDHGGSTKKLLRDILLSRTWQQISLPTRSPAEADLYREKDPENRYLSQALPRRRELESFRDTLLSVSGRLDLTPGGQADTITHPEARRRTIYGYIDRQNLPGFLRAFDLASPDQHAPRRFQTTVPQQALFLLNDPFLTLQAESLIETAPDNDQERVDFLYQRVLSRPPTEDERAEALAYIAAPPLRRTSGLWDYGYGFIDESAHRVQFTSFPHYQEKRWAGSAEPTHPEIGWAMISQNFAHPGSGSSRSVIWRWEAPAAGRYRWSGQIHRPSPDGDGIYFRIARSDGKTIHHQNVLPTEKFSPTTEAFDLQEGEPLLFIVDSRHSDNSDSFSLSGQIIDDATRVKITDMKEDFCSPALTPWLSYTQALLLSNELAFVD
jgi:hypothetical protein